MQAFLHKTVSVAQRKGFEPEIMSLKPFKIKAFSRRSPIVHQNKYRLSSQILLVFWREFLSIFYARESNFAVKCKLFTS